jgi:hypothetical protein
LRFGCARGRIDHDNFSIGLLLASGIFLMLVGQKYSVDPRRGNRALPNRALTTAAVFFAGTAVLFFVLAFIVSAAYVYLGGTSPAPRWIFNLFDGFNVVSIVDGVVGLFLFTLVGLRAPLRRLRPRPERSRRRSAEAAVLKALERYHAIFEDHLQDIRQRWRRRS